jgi:large subunit ribosomal protein L25
VANVQVLDAKVRDSRGTRHARRLRSSGWIPAILYGHGEESVSISVPAQQIDSMLRHGGRVVDFTGSVTGSAFLKEVQWDPFGTEVLHLDFTRVSKGEKVQTSISVELRGDAPGTHAGGIIQHVLHEVEINCPVQSIPEKILVNINGLNLGQSITAAELTLPEGAQLVTDPDVIVVQCVEPVEEKVVEMVAEGAEPEVIGRREEEGEAEE